MKILVTGAAGFIGYHLSQKLLEKGFEVLGIDNLNAYYDIELKYERLSQLGIKAIEGPINSVSKKYPKFVFIKVDIVNYAELEDLTQEFKPDIIVHLAAQAGVRYSIENPKEYISANVQGYFNVLELARKHMVNHLIYASSSSIYGNASEVPFLVDAKTDAPISLYAATKKSNELMAHTYAHLHKLSITGLRFFTVYGPYGRPDMAYFKFAKAIVEDKTIEIYNHGDQSRDFTYIDDTVEGLYQIIKKGFVKKSGVSHNVYNLGRGKPESLMTFVESIETALGKKAKKEFVANQPGDVSRTWADVSELTKDYGYVPKINLDEGVQKFVEWFKNSDNQKYQVR
ncbi:MAG: NAD-dependent epimerase/dehydratase family protein [Bacteroidota bacterium]